MDNKKQKKADIAIINNFIEKAGTLTYAALLMGVSRRSLGRYRDGERALPQEFKNKILEDGYAEMISNTIKIPGSLPASIDKDNILLFESKIKNESNVGIFQNEDSSLPLKTIAISLDYFNKNNKFTVVHGEDGCIILVNPDDVLEISAEYKNSEDPDVKFYRQNAMAFRESNCCFVKENDSISPSYQRDISKEDIKEFVNGDGFLGINQDNISFIIFDKKSSEIYKELLHDKILSLSKNNKLNISNNM